MKTGTERIAEERERQIAVEGWTPEHDDEHDCREIAFAATEYIMHYTAEGCPGNEPEEATDPSMWWPWERKWWKPSDDSVRNLVKAGALIAAEIDRLSRQNDQDQRPDEV